VDVKLASKKIKSSIMEARLASDVCVWDLGKAGLSLLQQGRCLIRKPRIRIPWRGSSAERISIHPDMAGDLPAAYQDERTMKYERGGSLQPFTCLDSSIDG